MPFSQIPIVRVNLPRLRGGQVFVSWQSTAAVGTWYQVYVNQTLSWFGQRCSVWIPVPSGPMRIDVGTVGAGEQVTNFSALLPAAPTRRCQLVWEGGTFLSTDMAGFRIYGSATPGGQIDSTAALADMTAYPAGIETDGYGLGSYGGGGFGLAGSTYLWTSPPLAAGIWSFAVAPYDSCGNEGTPQSTSIQIFCPPRAPTAFEDGHRLMCTLMGFGDGNFGSVPYGLSGAVLTWNVSST